MVVLQHLKGGMKNFHTCADAVKCLYKHVSCGCGAFVDSIGVCAFACSSGLDNSTRGSTRLQPCNWYNKEQLQSTQSQGAATKYRFTKFIASGVTMLMKYMHQIKAAHSMQCFLQICVESYLSFSSSL